MKKDRKIQKLMEVRSEAEKSIKHMTSADRKKLEIKLDVEHAYYSSALEGSKLDRRTFDELAKKAAV